MELTRNQMVKKAFQVAWPAILESVFVVLAGMIDTMMVATMGPYAVSAVGLTAQPKFIGLAAFLSINVAVSALVARRKGEENRSGANQVLMTALLICVFLCAVISVLFVVFSPTFMRWAGSNADTHDAAVIYFRVIMGGSIFNVITMVINAAQRGSGYTRISMTTNLTSSIVNIIFNDLLIGGHFGFPKWGIFGAAFATVLGTVVAAGMAIASLYRKQSYVSLPYMIREKIRPAGAVLKSIFSISSSVFFENIAMRIGFLATAVVAARLGTDPFAAQNVGMNLLGLAFSFADGMQVAAIALSGEALGAGKKERAKMYGGICQRMGFVISLCLSAALLLGGRWFFGLYFPNDPHIVDYGVTICRFMTVIVLLQISQIIFTGCLRAAGDVRYTLMTALISCTGIRTFVTIFAVSVLHLGLHGIWIGILSDQLARFILNGLRFRTGKWVDMRI